MITCYALSASDEPLQIRYVGATARTLQARLMQHRYAFCNAQKRAWMRDVEGRGARVIARQLSQHETRSDAKIAEKKWIVFWRTYCDVLNIHPVA